MDNTNDNRSISGRELKKLSRLEILELLLAESRRVEELEQTLADTRQQLRRRELDIQDSGSLAEAALRVNEVFAAAQAAADQYLENVRRNHPAAPGEEGSGDDEAARQLVETQCTLRLRAAEEDAQRLRREAEQELADASTHKDALLGETEARCRKLRQDTEAACVKRLEETKRQCDALLAEAAAAREAALQAAGAADAPVN